MTKIAYQRSPAVNLIQEALSRARMRPPQADGTEARRPARNIAIEARRRQAREIGHMEAAGRN
jgi:hypothetical protein